MSKSERFPWEFDGEVVVVETPEQARIEFRVAPFGARIAAALFDRALIGLVLLGLVVIGVVVALSVEVSGEVAGWALALLVIAWFLVTTMYFVIAEVRGEGRTPGKRWIGLRTVMGTGHGITVGASVVRNLARLVDEIPLFWLVPAMTTGNRRIGDLLAGTFVVFEAREPARVESSWIERIGPSWSSLEDRRFGFTQAHARELHPDDLNLIEYLDQRISSMPSRTRRRALKDIALRYVDRLELEEQREAVVADPARFLQELGLFLRAQYEDRPV